MILPAEISKTRLVQYTSLGSNRFVKNNESFVAAYVFSGQTLIFDKKCYYTLQIVGGISQQYFNKTKIYSSPILE